LQPFTGVARGDSVEHRDGAITQNHAVVQRPLLSTKVVNNAAGGVDVQCGISHVAAVPIQLDMLLTVENDVEQLIAQLLDVTGNMVGGHCSLTALLGNIKFNDEFKRCVLCNVDEPLVKSISINLTASSRLQPDA